MGKIDLSFDSGNLQFYLPVMIAPAGGPYVGSRPAGATGTFVNAEFLVDSGSNTSSLNEETAKKLGIDADHLPREETVGINGMAPEPVFPDKLTLYLNTDLDRAVIQRARVYRPLPKMVRSRAGTKLSRRQLVTVQMPNLFGLDAVKSINDRGGSLHLDLRSGVGTLEW